MISGTAGSTSFFLKKSCLETKRFSRHAWRVNDVVRPKTVEGRKDLQSFSKHSRTPITRVTMRPVSGLAILSLNPSLQMKLTDDYAAGNTDAHKSPVDERYRLFTTSLTRSVVSRYLGLFFHDFEHTFHVSAQALDPFGRVTILRR